MSSLRVAIVGCRGYPSHYGGFETFVRHLAPALVRRGHKVVVFGHGGRHWRKETHAGVDVINTPGLHSKSLATLSHGITASWVASRMGFDVALVLNVANGFFLPFFRRAGVPVALNVDGVEWARGKWGNVARATLRAGAYASARWADNLIADSMQLADIWKASYRVVPTYIPYGATVHSIRPGSELLEMHGVKPPYALVVARLVPENNVELTLDAFQAAKAPGTLVVVGSANFRYGLVDRLKKAQGDSHSGVHWLGAVSDDRLLHQLWAHCAVYVHGHEAGGTNPALLEALACGAPTTALATVFNREVIGQKPEALYPRCVNALSERIALAFQGHNGRLVTSIEGQRIIAARYTWNHVVDEYEQLLMGLVGTD